MTTLTSLKFPVPLLLSFAMTGPPLAKGPRLVRKRVRRVPLAERTASLSLTSRVNWERIKDFLKSTVHAVHHYFNSPHASRLGLVGISSLGRMTRKLGSRPRPVRISLRHSSWCQCSNSYIYRYLNYLRSLEASHHIFHQNIWFFSLVQFLNLQKKGKCCFSYFSRYYYLCS